MVNVVINHCPYIESLFGCEFVAVKLIGPTIKHYSIVLFKKHPTVQCDKQNGTKSCSFLENDVQPDLCAS